MRGRIRQGKRGTEWAASGLFLTVETGDFWCESLLLFLGVCGRALRMDPRVYTNGAERGPMPASSPGPRSRAKQSLLTHDQGL